MLHSLAQPRAALNSLHGWMQWNLLAALHNVAHQLSDSVSPTVMPVLHSLAPQEHLRLLRHHWRQRQQMNRRSVAISITAPTLTNLQTYDEPCFRYAWSFYC